MKEKSRTRKAAGNAFGRVVNEARTALGLSTGELARLAGVDRAFLMRVERGETSPTLTQLFKIAKALELNPSELVARTDRIVKQSQD